MQNAEHRKIDGHLDNIESYLRSMIRAPPPLSSAATRTACRHPPALAPVSSITYNTSIVMQAPPSWREENGGTVTHAGPLRPPPSPSFPQPPPVRTATEQASQHTNAIPTASASATAASKLCAPRPIRLPPSWSRPNAAPPSSLFSSSSPDDGVGFQRSSSLAKSDEVKTPEKVESSAASSASTSPLVPLLRPPPSVVPQLHKLAVTAAAMTKRSAAPDNGVALLSSEAQDSSSLPSSLNSSVDCSLTILLDKLERRFPRRPPPRRHLRAGAHEVADPSSPLVDMTGLTATSATATSAPSPSTSSSLSTLGSQKDSPLLKRYEEQISGTNSSALSALSHVTDSGERNSPIEADLHQTPPRRSSDASRHVSFPLSFPATAVYLSHTRAPQAKTARHFSYSVPVRHHPPRRVSKGTQYEIDDGDQRATHTPHQTSTPAPSTPPPNSLNLTSANNASLTSFESQRQTQEAQLKRPTAATHATTTRPTHCDAATNATPSRSHVATDATPTRPTHCDAATDATPSRSHVATQATPTRPMHCDAATNATPSRSHVTTEATPTRPTHCDAATNATPSRSHVATEATPTRPTHCDAATNATPSRSHVATEATPTRPTHCDAATNATPSRSHLATEATPTRPTHSDAATDATPT
ncbi:hypothetical protein N2W54_002229, partial [Lotmaria passim]